MAGVAVGLRQLHIELTKQLHLLRPPHDWQFLPLNLKKFQNACHPLILVYNYIKKHKHSTQEIKNAIRRLGK